MNSIYQFDAGNNIPSQQTNIFSQNNVMPSFTDGSGLPFNPNLLNDNGLNSIQLNQPMNLMGQFDPMNLNLDANPINPVGPEINLNQNPIDPNTPINPFESELNLNQNTTDPIISLGPSDPTNINSPINPITPNDGAIPMNPFGPEINLNQNSSHPIKPEIDFNQNVIQPDQGNLPINPTEQSIKFESNINLNLDQNPIQQSNQIVLEQQNPSIDLHLNQNPSLDLDMTSPGNPLGLDIKQPVQSFDVNMTSPGNPLVLDIKQPVQSLDLDKYAPGNPLELDMKQPVPSFEIEKYEKEIAELKEKVSILEREKQQLMSDKIALQEENEKLKMENEKLKQTQNTQTRVTHIDHYQNMQLTPEQMRNANIQHIYTGPVDKSFENGIQYDDIYIEVPFEHIYNTKQRYAFLYEKKKYPVNMNEAFYNGQIVSFFDNETNPTYCLRVHATYQKGTLYSIENGKLVLTLTVSSQFYGTTQQLSLLNGSTVQIPIQPGSFDLNNCGLLNDMGTRDPLNLRIQCQ